MRYRKPDERVNRQTRRVRYLRQVRDGGDHGGENQRNNSCLQQGDIGGADGI